MSKSTERRTVIVQYLIENGWRGMDAFTRTETSRPSRHVSQVEVWCKGAALLMVEQRADEHGGVTVWQLTAPRSIEWAATFEAITQYEVQCNVRDIS